MRLTLAAVTLVMLAACGGDPAAEPRAARGEPAPDPSAGRPAAAREVAPRATDAALVELGELRATVRALERRAGEAEAALVQAQAETAKYQAGLDRCVATLNSTTGQRAPATYVPAPAPNETVPWTRHAARVSSYLPPRVAIMADTARIWGTLYNSGDVTAEGNARVDLYRGDELFKSELVYLTIPARGETSWQTDIFVGTNASTWGNLSARVFWE